MFRIDLGSDWLEPPRSILFSNVAAVNTMSGNGSLMAHTHKEKEVADHHTQGNHSSNKLH